MIDRAYHVRGSKGCIGYLGYLGLAVVVYVAGDITKYGSLVAIQGQ